MENDRHLEDIHFQNAKIMEIERGFYFKNRQDAGQQLSSFLETKYKDLAPIVASIPRGGVEVAYYVAERLKVELILVVSKKLTLPDQPEYGTGAIAEDHFVYISPEGRAVLSFEDINRIVESQILEVDRG